MRFTETKLAGAFLIEPDRIDDQRGFFARIWSQREFEQRGVDSNLVECNISFNRKKGTLRGLHYQTAPHAQSKLVRCTIGAIFDVIVDLREDSPTFRQWASVRLSADNRALLFIPVGFAHGFQTLTDDSEVFYQMSSYYSAASSRGVRWDDRAFGIDWPEDSRVMNARDQNYPDFGT